MSSELLWKRKLKLFNLEENVSFSQEQKADVISQPIKNSCCKRALLHGILAAKGVLYDGMIAVSVDGSELVDYISGLVREIYSQEAVITNSKNGGRRKLICFKSKSAENYIADFSNTACCDEKCAMCHSSFFKGVFLVSGRICDPAKQYLLEFSVERTENFVSIFESVGLTPKVAKRANETVIYFKNSSMLEDFFAMANMNNTAFEIMNMKIQGELRNTANRIANCETNNIGRAVLASSEQISLINELIDRKLISLLPDELASTARFRVEHQDMSLSQMAGTITPPISKSGLAHRLIKITEIEKEILNEKEL